MFLSMFTFCKGVANHKFMTALISFIVWLALLALYIWMDTKAQAFVRDPSIYYSVNNWQENLFLLAFFIEMPGIVVWGKVFLNTFH